MFFSSVVLASVLTLSHQVAALGPVIDVGYSTYQGIRGNGVNSWLGVRYAEAPVGELRWRAPREPKPTTTLQNADKWGSACLSTPSTKKENGQDEDCLFLNIWAPQDTSKLHPVYVFIQGGGLNSNASPQMNGTQIVQAGDHDIVVVTLNYRVGVFGFLASEEIKKNGNLNVGNLDQRQALKWIQKYITKFGGDPKRVTLAGASAGGASVNLQVTAYGGRDEGLFQAVIGHSNSFGQQLTVAESQYQYFYLAQRAGCDQGEKAKDSLKCLRELSQDALLAINKVGSHPGNSRKPVFMYSNCIDGDFTPDYTYKLYAEGKFVKVPSIFGGDTNEGTLFTPSEMNNYGDMNSFLRANWIKLTAPQLAQIDHFYPQAEQFPNRGAYWRTSANAYGEMRYNCPGLTLSQTFAAVPGLKSWQYIWDVVSDENKKNGMGVTHTADCAAIWGSVGAPDNAQHPTISRYHASFVRTHDPNPLRQKGSPEWTPLVKDQGQKRMRFVNDVSKNAMENTDAGFLERCAYFASIGASVAM